MFPVAPRPESITPFLVPVCWSFCFVAGKRSAIEFCRDQKALAIANHEK